MAKLRTKKSTGWSIMRMHPFEIFGTLVGLAAASTLLPTIFAKMDAQFGWSLIHTFRFHLLFFAGLPVALVGFATFRELFITKKIRNQHIWLLSYPILPAAIFCLISDHSNSEVPFVASFAVANNLFLVVAMSFAFWSLSRTAKRSLALSNWRAFCQYITIGNCVTIALLSFCYPWIGSSSYAWILLVLAAVPVFAVIFLLFFDPSAKNWGTLAFAKIGFISLYFYPSLDLPYQILPITGIVLVLGAILRHFQINKLGKPKRAGFVFAVLFLIVISLWRLVPSDELRGEDFEKYYHQWISKMDEADTNGFYHKFLIPEQERSHDLLARLNQIYLLSGQDRANQYLANINSSEFEILPDPLVQAELLNQIDTTISIVRKHAFIRLDFVKSWLDHDDSIKAKRCIENYFPVLAKSFRLGSWEALGTIDTTLISKIQDLKKTRSGGIPNNERKSRLRFYEYLKVRLQRFKTNKQVQGAGALDYFTIMVKEMEGVDSLNMFVNILDLANVALIGGGEANMKTLREESDGFKASMDQILSKHIGARYESELESQERELTLLSLQLAYHQIDGLMFLAIQPNSKTLLGWQAAYTEYLGKFEQFWFVRPPEMARLSKGPFILSHVRGLIVYHTVSLTLLLVIAILFLSEGAARQFWAVLGFSCTVIFFLLYVILFDMGMENMLDIEKSRKMSAFSAWVYQVTDRDANTKSGNSSRQTANEGDVNRSYEELLESMNKNNQLLEVISDYYAKKEAELWN